VDAVGPLALLVEALATVRRQRISETCTGPEEALIEHAGTTRQHLHVAW
jgi:hypothetical protein